MSVLLILVVVVLKSYKMQFTAWLIRVLLDVDSG